MKTTITTPTAHGLSEGDTVNIGGETFTVTSVQTTTCDLVPLSWWRHALRWCVGLVPLRVRLWWHRTVRAAWGAS